MRTEVIKGSSEAALTVLQDNGLSFSEAVDLQNRAHKKKDKVLTDPGRRARMVFHSDGTYSAGPA